MATTSTEGSRRANCPMPRKYGEAAKRNRTSRLCLEDNGGYLMPSKIEYQLEDKSGASTRGNSSSKSVY